MRKIDSRGGQDWRRIEEKSRENTNEKSFQI